MSAKILSIGAPPAMHADRVIAAMLRELAHKRSLIAPAIMQAIDKSKDGGVRAQGRMAERIRQAGAIHVTLEPGTRGRYRMTIYEMVGWDAGMDAEITTGDRIPDKPWVAFLITIISDRGRSTRFAYILFITHHALSRAAQRAGVRTPQDIVDIMRDIWNAVMRDGKDLSEEEREHYFDMPPCGRRIRVPTRDITVVIKPHEKRTRSLVVTTVLGPGMGE